MVAAANSPTRAETSGDAPTGPAGTSASDGIRALKARLAATPRHSRPREHAAVAYRLGLAYAESPSGDATENLRNALACYDVAASIFDPLSDPVEHARALNAAGAAQRALGARDRAASLFDRAAALLEGRGRDEELAAALNNLGLVRTEIGDPEAAVAVFGRAVGLFDTATPEGRRGLAATLHNRGLAHASTGTIEGLEAALADYRRALDDIDIGEAPYHHGLVHHSLGVALSVVAGLRSPQRPDDRTGPLEEAILAFEESLVVFSRSDFPYQHALAKYNLGLAWAALAASAQSAAGAQLSDGAQSCAGTPELRMAMACFEDAVGVLDPRLHSDAWRRAYASLAAVEESLEPTYPGWTPLDHYVALLEDVGEEERLELLRDRVWRFTALPESRRHEAFSALAGAVLRRVPDIAREVLAAELTILMELPNEALESLLRAQMEVMGSLAPEERERADRVLDGAVGDALGGPQRVFVRDFLYSLGFVRP